MSFTIEEEHRYAELNRLNDECSNLREEFEQEMDERKHEIFKKMWEVCRAKGATYEEGFLEFEKFI